MAVQWFRDESTPDATADGSNIAATIGYVLSEGVDPVAVANNPTAFLGGPNGDEPLPAYRSPYPSNPRLTLDSYRVSTDGAINRIIGQYSSDRRFTFPNNNTPPPTGFRWSVTTETYGYALPYAARGIDLGQPDPNFVGPNPPPTLIDKWVYLDESVFEKVQKVSMEFTVAANLVGNAIETFFEQTNEVHRINGKYWLFEGGEVNFDGENYRARASWVREKGVWMNYADYLSTQLRMPAVRAQLSDLDSPAPGFGPDYPAGSWAKPPLHKTIIVPPDTGKAIDPPTFVAVLPYNFNANGWDQIAALIP